MNTNLAIEYPDEFQAMVTLFRSSGLCQSAIDIKELQSKIQGNKILEQLLGGMSDHFNKYIEILLQFEKAAKIADRDTAEKFAELDKARKISHDAMISHVNIFVRNARKAGIDLPWAVNIRPGDRVSYAQIAMATAFCELTSN